MSSKRIAVYFALELVLTYAVYYSFKSGLAFDGAVALGVLMYVCKREGKDEIRRDV